MLPKSLTDSSGGVFFLYGDDEFRRAQAAAQIVERHLDPGTRDFNLDVLRASEASYEQIASVLATPPMMAEWRVVRVQAAGALAGSPKAKKALLEVVSNPPPGLVLVLEARIPAQSKAKFYEDLKKRAKAAEFREIPPHDAAAWLIVWAADELDVTVEEDAARALATAIGSDLGLLTNEVRKLATMVGEGEPVTRESVEKGGIQVPKQDRWKWFDMVGNRKVDEAVHGLGILLEQGESPVGLVIGLTTQMLRIGVAVEGGRGALESALPPYQRFLTDRLMTQSRRWTRDEVRAAVRGLRRLDQLLKASSIDGDVLVEAWLMGTLVSASASAA